MKIQEIQISLIQLDRDFYPRSSISETVIGSYVDALAKGSHFPPIVVFEDHGTFWLADGFLRIEALRKLGGLTVTAEVHQGKKRDAMLYSLATNATHGLGRTEEDKQWVILKLLRDLEWGKWTDQEIARYCNVSDRLVRELRSRL